MCNHKFNIIFKIDILLVISYDENPVVMHEKKLENYKIWLEFSIDYLKKKIINHKIMDSNC